MVMSVNGGALGAANGSAPWDGIIGMGRPGLAAGNMAPPVAAAAQQGALPAAIFGLWLAHDASAPGRGGEVALGGWNSARTSGDINWVPVARAPGAQQGYWSVALQGVKLTFKPGGAPAGAADAAAAPEVVFCASNSSGTAADSGARRRRGRSGEEGNIPLCVGTFDSGTALLTGSVRQFGSLVQRLGFAPGVPSPPDGCAAVVDRMLQLVTQAGADDPASPTAMAEACTALPEGPLSPQGLLCGAIVARLSAAIAEAQGPPMPNQVGEVKAGSAEDCGVLPYCINATIDCTKVKDLPTISFIIGGQEYSVAPQQYTALVGVGCAVAGAIWFAQLLSPFRIRLDPLFLLCCHASAGFRVPRSPRPEVRPIPTPTHPLQCPLPRAPTTRASACCRASATCPRASSSWATR
jgi:phytepsin